MPSLIEDYALIGDCETAALVSRGGSIDWLCWPRFDSDACFAALLGDASHGRWLIAASDEHAEITRKYRNRSLILETRFTTASGTVLLLDFMPPRGKASDIVRLVIGEQGQVDMRTELTIRFGYGATVPWMTRIAPNTWRAISGPDMLVIRTPVDLQGVNLHTTAQFCVSAGETVPFVITYSPSHLPIPEEIDIGEALSNTEKFWEEWVQRGTESECGSEAVIRSLITLRALIYSPTGGIVAAPTTSLPEQLGGTRNWDYRFCWLRDATLTLLALMNSGYREEAAAWCDWLLRAIAGSPEQMQTMYGIAGERRLTEWEVPWLPGYQNSRPVRIGNGAHAQLQLDVYGEVMDALYQARVLGLKFDDMAWATQRVLLKHLASIWRQPDYGLWEVRAEPLHFTYSKVMVWVAFDRAVKTAERFGLDGPVEEWRALRDRVHAEVCERGFDAQRNCFVQSYGSRALDASLLLIPAVGFLPPDDSRVRGTLAAIEKELLRDGFVLRYDTGETSDGLPPGEGAFLACSFWLADAYAMSGRRAEAQRLYERLLTLRNDLGLLAEEYDPRARCLVGNFPQAFSHLSLIGTAYNLAHADKPAEQRSESAIPNR